MVRSAARLGGRTTRADGREQLHVALPKNLIHPVSVQDRSKQYHAKEAFTMLKQLVVFIPGKNRVNSAAEKVSD